MVFNSTVVPVFMLRLHIFSGAGIGYILEFLNLCDETYKMGYNELHRK